MPHVVNGCGTWYHGKKNVLTYEGVCTACKNRTVLTSYDTRLFVVVVFIPIIPLGRKRIIEQCGVCQRHGALPWVEWERAQARIQESIAAYRQIPTDPQRAKDAMSACLSVRSLPSLREVAPDIEAYLADDARSLQLLAGAFGIFGCLSDVQRTLELARAADDSDETREMLADCLIQQGKPEEAEPYAWHVIETGVPDRVDLIYALAQGFQIKGNHEKALEHFDHCEAINPGIANDATFIRLREASQKNLGTTKAVLPNKLVQGMKNAAARRRAAIMVGAALLIALVVYLGIGIARGANRAVHLVNGLGRPYSVKVNGVPHTLPPGQPTVIRVAEGDLKIEMIDVGQGLGVQTASVRSPLLTRTFNGRVFVVNPDQTAVLERIRVFYHAPSKTGRDPEFRYLSGQLVHEIDGIDDVFSEPPQSMRIKEHGETSRDVLRLFAGPTGKGVNLALANVADQIGKESMIRLCKQHLTVDPDDTGYLNLLAVQTTPEDMVAFAKPFLARRPINVEWHRVYQTTMDQAGQSAAVEEEYAQMLAKDPGNRDLMYLAGRAAFDPDLSDSLMEQATRGNPSMPFAHYTLSGRYLACGRFDLALRHAELAAKTMPDKTIGSMRLAATRLAAGEFDALIAQHLKEESAPLPMNILAFMGEATAHANHGRADLASKTVGRLAKALGEAPPDQIESMTRRLRATLDYMDGRPDDFIATQSKAEDPESRFAAQLTAGRFAEATKELDSVRDVRTPTRSMTPTVARDRLLLYILAMRDRREADTRAQLAAAVKALQAGSRANRAMAAALSGKPELPLEKLLRFYDEPKDKAVFLVALGLAQPDTRDRAFELAGKLNFDRQYPHLLLNDVLKSSSPRRSQ